MLIFRRLGHLYVTKFHWCALLVLTLMGTAFYILREHFSAHVIRSLFPNDKWRWYPYTSKQPAVEHLRLYHFDVVHVKRKRHLTSVCHRIKDHHSYMSGFGNDTVKRNFLLDRNHHVLFCRVEKIGSKFIVNFLRKLEKVKMPGNIKKEKNITARGLLKSKKLSVVSDFTNIGMTDFHQAVMKSFKFMFVREPYGRLVSGYVDKFFMPNTLFWRTIGRFAYNMLHDVDVTCGNRLSFPDFLRYVVYGEQTGDHKNRHFTSISEHCKPCDISYDFIGKIETFKNDFTMLYTAWNKIYDTNVTFSDFESETAYERAMFYSKRLYGMKTGIEECVSFYEGMKRTWIGLQIQGIIPKYVRIPFTKFEAAGVTLERFQSAVGAAINSTIDKSAVKYQKIEAVIEAYSLVPLNDLITIRELVRQDCQLFGYDESPQPIFGNKTNGNKNNLEYFKTYRT